MEYFPAQARPRTETPTELPRNRLTGSYCVIRLTCTAALLLSCFPAAADTLAPITVEAEELQVGDTPRVGDVVLEEHTGSHARISAEQLRRPGNSLGQALAFEPGVQNNQAGAEGSYSTVTVRGASAAQTPIYWDGIRLNGASQPAVDLSDLEVLNLESVDIFRGRSPLQLGGGIGGAVALNSPRGQRDSTALRLHYGSFGSSGVQLGTSFSGQRWHNNTAFSHHQAENDFSLINDNGTNLNPDDDRRERMHNASFTRDSFLSLLSFNPSADIHYDISAQYTARDSGVPEWHNDEANQASYATRTALLQANQRITAVQGSDWNTRFGVHAQRRRDVYDDSLSQVGLGAQHTRARGDNKGLSAFTEYLGERGTFSVQADIREEKLRQDDWIDAESSEAKRKEHNLSLSYIRFSEDERWLASVGSQWQSLEDRYDGLYREGKDRRSGDHHGVDAGLQFSPTANSRWQFNLSKIFREPSFHELFGDRGLHVGNEELLAEVGSNADLSLQRTYDNGEWTFGLFQSDRDNLIASVFNARGIGHSENVGRAQVRGIEFSSALALSDRWSTRVSATAQDAENRSRTRAFSGKQLPGQAQLLASARFKYTRVRDSAWLEVRGHSGKYYDTANLLPAKDALVLNAGASFLRQAWTIDLSLNNLNDEQIEDFNGFAKPGRSVHIAVGYRFR